MIVACLFIFQAKNLDIVGNTLRLLVKVYEAQSAVQKPPPGLYITSEVLMGSVYLSIDLQQVPPVCRVTPTRILLERDSESVSFGCK